MTDLHQKKQNQALEIISQIQLLFMAQQISCFFRKLTENCGNFENWHFANPIIAAPCLSVCGTRTWTEWRRSITIWYGRCSRRDSELFENYRTLAEQHLVSGYRVRHIHLLIDCRFIDYWYYWLLIYWINKNLEGGGCVWGERCNWDERGNNKHSKRGREIKDQRSRIKMEIAEKPGRSIYRESRGRVRRIIFTKVRYLNERKVGVSSFRRLSQRSD